MEKCLNHPWATNEDGYCWKCRETIKTYKFMANYTEPKIPDLITAPNDTVTTSVMKDLKSRADRGLKKYNTTLGENNHQNMLQHAYEEALDLAQYLKKEITTLNTIQDLVKQYPKDAELGMIIREKYSQEKI